METKTAAMSDATVRQMISLLKDPVFCGLRVLADERPLTREEFEMLAMPEGVSREQAWDILNALRRQTAVELPFRDGEGRRGWYYPTRSIVANLDDIDKRCHAGSWLDLAVRSRNATYFLVEAHVDEAVATLKEDGLSIGYEKTREVLLSERDPETSEERLLLNWHRTAWHLEELAGRPCTPEIVLEVYERVSRGVERQVTRSSRQVPACGSASRSIALRRSRSCRRSSRRTAKRMPSIRCCWPWASATCS